VRRKVLGPYDYEVNVYRRLSKFAQSLSHQPDLWNILHEVLQRPVE
jgi:hypothetical protein